MNFDAYYREGRREWGVTWGQARDCLREKWNKSVRTGPHCHVKLDEIALSFCWDPHKSASLSALIFVFPQANLVTS